MGSSESPYQSTSAPTPFQKVVGDLNNGCQCACHFGVGTQAACGHCMHLYTNYQQDMHKHCWHQMTELNKNDKSRERCCWCGLYWDSDHQTHGNYR